MGFFDTIDRLKNTETEPQPVIITEQDSQGSEKKSHSGPFQVKKKASSKPERLSFLRPCLLCGGKKFIYGTVGGFFCLACQPGIVGIQVEAGGADRQDPDQEAALQVDAGQHENESKNICQIQEKAYFMMALPWIKSKLPKLLAAGWTRAALLQRSKYRYPTGWGIAWFSIWKQDALAVTIGKNGEIFFTFQSCGRTITQTARPPIKKTAHRQEK
jgi:hypothetical protein